MGAWQLMAVVTSPSLVELSGSPVALFCLVMCRFLGESLARAGDNGAVGIIFLFVDVTVRASTCRDNFSP